MSTFHYIPCPTTAVSSLGSEDYDAVVLVAPSVAALTSDLAVFKKDIDAWASVDKSVGSGAHVIPTNGKQKLIYSSTGSVTGDTDDVRRFAEAAAAGIDRATCAGSKSPIICVQPHADYKNAELVTLIGAMTQLYVPIEAKKDGIACKATKLGVYSTSGNTEDLVKLATALEAGQTVMRDIYGSDPVFMAPPSLAKYIKGMLDNSEHVKAEIISDQKRISTEYPTVAAVNRGCNAYEQFEARIVKLAYTGEGDIKQTLMFVGKGVTFDTGGSDLKVGGVMAGMRCDKGGAATIAAFFKILSILRPKGMKVVATLPLVRNALGPESYTCDEIIKSRSGKRLRIINTDAEGRMIMVDPLCEMREQAVKEINPQLFTIATLTGHALFMVGPYPIVMDNGAAKLNKTAEQLKAAGEAIGNPFEITSLRREDFEAVKNHNVYADLKQAPLKPSTQTIRGHQIPMAFLIEGSLLSQHGRDSSHPIKYSHLDIAGVPFEPMPEASPLLAFANRYILPNI